MKHSNSLLLILGIYAPTVLSFQAIFPPRSRALYNIQAGDTECHFIEQKFANQAQNVDILMIPCRNCADSLPTGIALYQDAKSCEDRVPLYIAKLVPLDNSFQFYNLNGVALKVGGYPNVQSIPTIQYWRQFVPGTWDNPEAILATEKGLEYGDVLLRAHQPNTGGLLWDKDTAVQFDLQLDWVAKGVDPDKSTEELRTQESQKAKAEMQAILSNLTPADSAEETGAQEKQVAEPGPPAMANTNTPADAPPDFEIVFSEEEIPSEIENNGYDEDILQAQEESYNLQNQEKEDVETIRKAQERAREERRRSSIWTPRSPSNSQNLEDLDGIWRDRYELEKGNVGNTWSMLTDVLKSSGPKDKSLIKYGGKMGLTQEQIDANRALSQKIRDGRMENTGIVKIYDPSALQAAALQAIPFKTAHQNMRAPVRKNENLKPLQDAKITLTTDTTPPREIRLDPSFLSTPNPESVTQPRSRFPNQMQREAQRTFWRTMGQKMSHLFKKPKQDSPSDGGGSVRTATASDTISDKDPETSNEASTSNESA